MHDINTAAGIRPQPAPASGNLADDLTAQALYRPDATAIDDIQGPVSFQALESMTWQGTALLAKNGVGPGDVLAMAFADEYSLIIALLASARIGATAIAMPMTMALPLRRTIATESKARFLVSDSPDRDGVIPGFIAFRRGQLGQPEGAIDRSVRCAAPTAPWLLIRGSGSTGRSRLIPVGHAQFRARRTLYGGALGLAPRDRLASLVSFSYAMSMQRGLEALSLGATLVLLDTARRAPMPRVIDAGVTVIYATGIQAEALLRTVPAGSGPLLPDVRALMLGSGVIPDGLRNRVRQHLTPNLYVYYATNESGLVTIASPADQRADPATIGRPVAGVSLEIVDGNGKVLPAGRTGLIRIQSPATVNGYLDDPEATAERFTAQGFYPRDMGLLRPDGLLTFAGRSDDMMIMNGINIFPAEIETIMTGHPHVVDAKAFPLKHPLHQDIPVCVVVLAEQAAFSEHRLLEFAREHLGSHAPQRIFSIAELPRNEEGKVLRRLLMESISAQLMAEARDRSKTA